MLSRRAVIGGLSASLVSMQARAAWPERPITLLHGFGPGGGADITARLIGEALGRALGQSVVIEPKPGAGTTLASAQLAQSAPDGYTLAIIASSYSSTAALYKSLPYRPLEDITLISLVGQSPFVLANNAESDIRTFSGLLDATRKGPLLSYGTSGVGSGAHLTMEYLSQLADVKFQHVPFRGGAQAIVEVLGKRIDFMVDPPLSMMEQLKAGKLRALAVASSQRAPGFPDVGTVAEAGFAGFNMSAWYGLAGPPKLPDVIARQLHDATATALSADSFKQKFRNVGSDPGASSPQDFKDLIASEISRWTAVIEKAHLERI
jgi:tripartite-type tricarboxylate transporter receptor subunit TctC